MAEARLASSPGSGTTVGRVQADTCVPTTERTRTVAGSAIGTLSAQHEASGMTCALAMKRPTGLLTGVTSISQLSTGRTLCG